MLADSQRRRRALARRADQLLRAPGAYIACRENAFRARLEVNAGHNKALGVHFRDIFKRLTIRRKADEDKDARHVQFFCLTCLDVLIDHSVQVAIFAFELHHLRIEEHFHFRRVQRLVSCYLIGRQLRASHQQRHLGTKPREKRGFLDRAVAAADHRNLSPFIKGAITGRAEMHARADILILTWHTQAFIGGTRSDQDGVRAIFMP